MQAIKRMQLAIYIIFFLYGCTDRPRYEIRECEGEKAFSLSDCESKCIPAKGNITFTFEVNEKSNTVLNNMFESGGRQPIAGWIYSDCAIFDSENWHCKSPLINNEAHEMMINGTYIHVDFSKVTNESCGIKLKN